MPKTPGNPIIVKILRILQGGYGGVHGVHTSLPHVISLGVALKDCLRMKPFNNGNDVTTVACRHAATDSVEEIGAGVAPFMGSTEGGATHPLKRTLKKGPPASVSEAKRCQIPHSIEKG